ncbi:hypothetical protein [Acidovorax sp. SUPP3334]|uniref:hypothetical protein n=1 Tax=Acidovorax sp. SUPP3334 TaxID=2920881 RepID=UPI0023DE4A7D|nr:hypothetical protein [Acidovorax sp. SUPP3334]GKT26203.1 hypothetical protein AVHM3334_20335 [Acidovorax sp. SUPP3334]
MPEGPSIVILKEAAQRFKGRTIERVQGNTGIAKERLAGRRIVAVRSWGKHFLLEMDGLAPPDDLPALPDSAAACQAGPHEPPRRLLRALPGALWRCRHGRGAGGCTGEKTNGETRGGSGCQKERSFESRSHRTAPGAQGKESTDAEIQFAGFETFNHLGAGGACRIASTPTPTPTHRIAEVISPPAATATYLACLPNLSLP